MALATLHCGLGICCLPMRGDPRCVHSAAFGSQGRIASLAKHRERIFAALAGLGAALTLGCSQRNAPASAVLSGYQPEIPVVKERATLARLDGNTFTVKVKDYSPSMSPQKNESWCWAACAVEILAQEGIVNPETGIAFTQDDLIRRTVEFRQRQSVPATTALLWLAPETLSAYQKAMAAADERRNSEAPGNNYTFEQEEPAVPILGGAAVLAISRGELALIAQENEDGSGGHILVAYEVTYSKAAVDRWNRAHFRVHRLMAVDPSTGTHVEIEGDGLDRITLAGGRSAAQDYARRAIDAANHARWVYVPPGKSVSGSSSSTSDSQKSKSKQQRKKSK